LSSGEFVGVLADDPDTPLIIKNFHAKLKKELSDNLPPTELPIIEPVDKDLLMENSNRIKSEIVQLVATETKRIMTDPALRKFVVKR
jgi:hypothetical protein